MCYLTFDLLGRCVFLCIKVVFGNVCQEEKEEAAEKVGQKFTSTSNTSLISLLESM